MTTQDIVLYKGQKIRLTLGPNAGEIITITGRMADYPTYYGTSETGKDYIIVWKSEFELVKEEKGK